MLHITTMNNEETRYLSEVRTLWQTVGPLMRRKSAFVGGMQWKTVGGREYLYRYQPDPVTRKKRSTSIGPRSPETEAAHAEFLASREQVRAELAEVMPMLDTFARMGKALRLNRLPEPVADILEALQEDGLLELAPLAGEYAIRAFEVHYRQSYGFELPVDRPREIQFMVPDEMDLVRALTRAFLRVDPEYRMDDYSVLRGIEGPTIRLTLQSELVEKAENVLPEDHFDLFLSMLELEPTVEVAVSKSGRPVQVAAVDPALWGAMFAMDDGDEVLARAIAGRNAEFEEASGGLLGDMIGLLAEAPRDRGPRI